MNSPNPTPQMDSLLFKHLLALKDSGNESFEELVYRLIERLTNVRLLPFASGWQAGKDSETIELDRAVQCKRYKESPSAKELCGDLTMAANSKDQLDIWIVACPSVIKAQARNELRTTGMARGIQVVYLDGLILEALVCQFPRLSTEYIPDAALLNTLSKKKTEEHTFQLSLFEKEVAKHPLPTLVEQATKNVLRSKLDGSSLGLGRRLSLENYVAREQEKELNNWGTSLSANPKPLVLLAGEGMGKTTMVANWVLETPTLPILWVSPQDVDKDSTLSSLVADGLKKAGDFAGFVADSRSWDRRLQRWLRAKTRRLVVVLDGLNEVTDTRVSAALVKSVLDEVNWRNVVVFLLTGRSDWWNRVTTPQQRESADSWLVKEYSDPELRRALQGTVVELREISRETLKLFRIPLLFESIRVEASRGVDVRELNRESIYWLGIRQRLGSRLGLVRGLKLESDQDVKTFLSGLAERYLGREGKSAGMTRQETRLATESFLEGPASFADALQQLQSAEFLKGRRDRYEINKDLLVLGLGLTLLYRALERAEEDADHSRDWLVSQIETLLEPSLGLERNALEAALYFSLSEDPSRALNSVRYGLLFVWVRERNFSDASEKTFRFLLPRMTDSFLDLAESIWKEWNALQRVRSLIVDGLLKLQKEKGADSILTARLDRWLRLAHKAHLQNAVLPTYRKAAEKASGYSQLIDELGLLEAANLAQTNLFYLAYALVSASPHPSLFPSILQSRVAGEISGRGELRELSAWTAAVSFGSEFHQYLSQKSFPESELLETARKSYLTLCQYRGPDETFLNREEKLTAKIFDDLESTEISPRLFLNEYGSLVLSLDFAEQLEQNQTAASHFRAILKEGIESFELTNPDWAFWRHRSQNRGTLLWKSLELPLCVHSPSDWASLLQCQLRALAAKLPEHSNIHSLAILAPVLEKTSVRVLFEQKAKKLADLDYEGKVGVNGLEIEAQELLCLLAFSAETSEELLSYLERIPPDALCLLPLADAVEAIGTRELAEGLIHRCESDDGKFNHFLLSLLSRLGDYIPEETEALGLRLCGLPTKREVQSGELILSRLTTCDGLDSILRILASATKQESGGRRLAELRVLDEYETSPNMPLKQAGKLLSLEFVGGVIRESEIPEYASSLESIFCMQSGNSQPTTDLDVEVYLRDDRSDCGGIRQASTEESVTDFRGVGHWKGPDEWDESSAFGGDLQAAVDAELEDWLMAYKRRKDFEPFYSEWVYDGSLERIAQFAPEFLARWADELIDADDERRARLVFSRAAFYWMLTFAILPIDSKRGVSLWNILDSLSRFIITDRTLPIKFGEIFRPTDDAAIMALRKQIWSVTTTDLRLHYLALAAAQGDLAWFETFLNGKLSSGSVLERAKAAMSLGWLPFSNDRLNQLLVLEREDNSEFVARVAAEGVQAQRRDQSARHWFRGLIGASDDVHAAAAAQVFSGLADARALRWVNEEMPAREAQSKTLRYLLVMVFHRLNHQIRRQQDGLQNTFLGWKRRPLKDRTVPFLLEQEPRF